MPAQQVELDAEPLVVVGRIMPASNQTFLAELGDSGTRCVYKPIWGSARCGTSPTAPSPAASTPPWVVSDHVGWDVVPPTVLRDGPAGPGMVQLWMDTEEDVDPVDVVPEGPVPAGYLHVLDATGGRDEPVMLVHEDSDPLRRMAVFDLVTNNTDRKGGHVLPVTGGHRYGVDHGVCFHTDDKLRTVLWGWAGERLRPEEVAGVEAVLDGVQDSAEGGLRERLEDLLTVAEVEAVRRRCERLLRTGSFPVPSGGWPAIPWPPF